MFWEGIDTESGQRRLMAAARKYRSSVKGRGPELQQVLNDLYNVRASQSLPPLKQLFDELCDGLRWQRSIPMSLKPKRREFIGSIRQAMATVGIKMLQPDLVVLDVGLNVHAVVCNGRWIGESVSGA